MQLLPRLPDTGCGQVASLSKFGTLVLRTAFLEHIAAYHVFLVLAQKQLVAFGGEPFRIAVP